MIRLVCGPPGAGKTTFVGERRSDGDLVVDLDAISIDARLTSSFMIVPEAATCCFLVR